MKQLTRKEFFDEYTLMLKEVVENDDILKKLVKEYGELKDFNDSLYNEVKDVHGFKALLKKNKVDTYEDNILKLADIEVKIIERINEIESYKGWKVPAKILKKQIDKEQLSFALNIDGHGEIHNEAFELGKLPSPSSIEIKQKVKPGMIDELESAEYVSILYKFPTIMSEDDHGFIDVIEGNIVVLNMRVIAVYPV